MKLTTKLKTEAIVCLLVSLGIAAFGFVSVVPEFVFMASGIWFLAALLMFGLYKQAKVSEVK